MVARRRHRLEYDSDRSAVRSLATKANQRVFFQPANTDRYTTHNDVSDDLLHSYREYREFNIAATVVAPAQGALSDDAV